MIPTSRPSPRRRAFTLIELVTSIVVIAIVASVVMPVVLAATDTYSSASSTRGAAERTAFALDRSIRLLRDAPLNAAGTALDISVATSTGITYADGRKLELVGTELRLTWTEAGVTQTATLLDNVQTFQLQYLASDGTTSTLSTPSTTQRFVITLKAAGLELRSAAFPRVRSFS